MNEQKEQITPPGLSENEVQPAKPAEISELENRIVALTTELADLQDKHLRLSADFDNHRKRTSRERIDLIRNAGSEIISALLPGLDDLERALKQSAGTATEAGIKLVYLKLLGVLKQFGLREMMSIGENFDADLHEAISEAPAKNKKQKGKVVDEIEKGYFLHESILRHAKVVVGK